MQRVDSLKEVYNSQLNTNQYISLVKNVFMNCPIHKYEPICYINISQKNISQDVFDNSEIRDYDESQSSEDNEEIKGLIMKEEDEQSITSNIGQSNRFLCAECNLVSDIDKKYLLPLRKLVFNQDKLYNNWPPLEQDLNSKLYDILRIPKEQHECMVEIDKTCSSLIEQFSMLVNQLKKDLMRIEGERYQILADLQKMYDDISSIDTFSGLLTQQNSSQQSSSGLSSTQQNQLSPPSSSVNIKDQYNFDFDQLFKNTENLLTDSQSQQLSQVQPLNRITSRSNSQQAQEEETNVNLNNNGNGRQQTQTIDSIRRKIEDFVDQKYSEKKSNSQKLAKLVQQLNKFKPLEENLKSLREFGKKMQLKLSTLSNQIKFKMNLTEFQMQKSLFKNSSLLNIDRNYKNQITVHTQGQIWGQVYSDFILDCQLTYQFIFQFKQEVQNFIIIGLIPDAYKDQISQGSSQNHFGKIFGQENVTYCGSIIKGSSQLSFLKKNDMIMMEVCVSKNHLTFTDLPKQANITKLHSDYSLNPNGRYRMCIEFYDFEEENTITLIDAKCY